MVSQSLGPGLTPPYRNGKMKTPAREKKRLEAKVERKGGCFSLGMKRMTKTRRGEGGGAENREEDKGKEC